MRKFFNFSFIFTSFLILMLLLTKMYVNKFSEQYFISDGYQHSSLYQEDAISYFKVSDKITHDISEGKKIYSSGGEYKFSFLYPRIIYFFNKIFNSSEKIVDNNKLEINLKKLNFFLYFQVIFFYLSILFLYFSLLKIVDKSLSKIVCVILLINPIIFQWHLSFYTESIFLSFLILLICFLLRSKNSLNFFFVGLFIGIMYTQRTIALLYPLVIFFYIIFLNNHLKEKILKFFSLIIGMCLILILIGFYNYNRAQIFYVTPIQSKLDIQTYLEPNILKISKKISVEEARKKIEDYNLGLIDIYNYDLTKETDKILYLNKIQKNSFKTLMNNKAIALKIIMKNYFHSVLLNPVQVFYEAKYKSWIDYKKSDDHKFWLIVRIIITPIFFIFSGLGIIFSVKKIDFKLNLFLFLSTIYFMGISCWLPNTRYFIPSVLFMSIYLSIALYEINLYMRKKQATSI